MAIGYRVGWPGELVARRVLNFEYDELDNWTTLLDLADFLKVKVPKDSDENYNINLWNQLLARFKSRYGNIKGVWVCKKKSDAIYYYGEYGGDIYKVTYNARNVITDLGDDGTFVIEPFTIEEVGAVPEKHPSAYRDRNPRRLRLPRWVSINPGRKWHLDQLRFKAAVLEKIPKGETGHRQYHLGEMAAQRASAQKSGATWDEIMEAQGGVAPSANPRHVLTKEERQRGFRRAVEQIQIRHGMDFNEAVQWLLRRSARKAGYSGDWIAYREARAAASNPSQGSQNGKIGGFLPVGDKVFIEERLKPYFGIDSLRIGWSDSRKKWPDIWCENGGVPRIVVTREWQRQGVHERRKRLVHEALHIAKKLEHGVYEGYRYSTIPAEDEYSRIIYNRIMQWGRNPGATRVWQNYEVDVDLKNRWLMAINRIPEYEVRSVCTGHEERRKWGAYPSFGGVLKWLHGDSRTVIRKALAMKRELVRRLPNTMVDINFQSGGGGVVYDQAGRRRKATGMPRLEALWKKHEHYISEVWFSFYYKVPNKPENRILVENWWETSPAFIKAVFRKAKSSNPRRVGPPWDPIIDDDEDEENIPIGIEIG